MRITCVLVLLIVLTKGMAQNDFHSGYIITLNNDTLAGLINPSAERIREGKCEFRRGQDAPVEVFTPAMLEGFGFPAKDQVFLTYELSSGERVFADLLFRGRASLFYYDNFFYLQKDSLREKIEKVQMRESNIQGGRYVFSHKTYIGILNRYFSDCLPPKLLRGEVEYKARDFVNIFKEYSECSDAEYHVFKTPRQRRKISFYVLAGLNFSSLKYQQEDLDIFKSDNNFFLGGGVLVPVSFVSDNLFLTGEVSYQRNVYSGKKEGYVGPGWAEKDYSLEMSMIKVPLGLRYNITRRGLIPYLKGGLTPFFPMRGYWSIRYQGATEAEYQIGEKTASLVYWGGLGLEQKINSKRSLFVEFRMERFNDYIGFYGPNGATNIPSVLSNKMLVFGMNF